MGREGWREGEAWRGEGERDEGRTLLVLHLNFACIVAHEVYCK